MIIRFRIANYAVDGKEMRIHVRYICCDCLSVDIVSFVSISGAKRCRVYFVRSFPLQSTEFSWRRVVLGVEDADRLGLHDELYMLFSYLLHRM